MVEHLSVTNANKCIDFPGTLRWLKKCLSIELPSFLHDPLDNFLVIVTILFGLVNFSRYTFSVVVIMCVSINVWNFRILLFIFVESSQGCQNSINERQSILLFAYTMCSLIKDFESGCHIIDGRNCISFGNVDLRVGPSDNTCWSWTVTLCWNRRWSIQRDQLYRLFADIPARSSNWRLCHFLFLGILLKI